MNRFEAVREWAEAKAAELFEKYLKFNQLDPDGIAITHEASEGNKVTFLDGSIKADIVFYIVAQIPFSEETDNVNTDGLSLFDDFADWIEEREESGDYPAMPQNYTVLAVKTNTNSASNLQVDIEAMKIRYMLGFTVTYLKKRG